MSYVAILSRGCERTHGRTRTMWRFGFPGAPTDFRTETCLWSRADFPVFSGWSLRFYISIDRPESGESSAQPTSLAVARLCYRSTPSVEWRHRSPSSFSGRRRPQSNRVKVHVSPLLVTRSKVHAQSRERILLRGYPCGRAQLSRCNNNSNSSRLQPHHQRCSQGPRLPVLSWMAILTTSLLSST